jgi:hypothetical protein
MGFKLENVFRSSIFEKKIGDMEIEKFITDDKKTIVIKVSLGKFVVEKSFQNNLYGKDCLEDFEKRVQTEEDFKKYLGVL